MDGKHRRAAKWEPGATPGNPPSAARPRAHWLVAAASQLRSAMASAEETVIANAVKACGQHVQEVSRVRTRHPDRGYSQFPVFAYIALSGDGGIAGEPRIEEHPQVRFLRSR